MLPLGHYRPTLTNADHDAFFVQAAIVAIHRCTMLQEGGMWYAAYSQFECMEMRCIVVLMSTRMKHNSAVQESCKLLLKLGEPQLLDSVLSCLYVAWDGVISSDANE